MPRGPRARRPAGRTAARLGGLVLGVGLDALIADPPRWHPVAGFGRAAAGLERRLYRDGRAAGAAHTAVLIAAVTVPAALADRALADRTRPSRARSVLATAALTWVVLGGTSLRRAGRGIGAALADDDLPAARERLPTLCGRDPATLDATGIARGAVESIAENTCDAVVAPLWWGAVGGLPGLAAYRAVNTLDAMIGHHSPRYERFGWAAARLDDLANLLPARLCALAACACAPLVGGSAVDAWWVLRRDGRSHPSPNAGLVEAAFAGALGLRLGGELRYPYRVEHRSELGFGRRPEGADVAAAARLSAAAGTVSLAVTVLAAASGAALRARWRQPPPG
ncbi:cobalamin biosynthesis protein [Frankia sp. AgB32]|uniref:cobalamin biosynthesis protein n=1 Tax=Frankia sp. AgB32 TaxID=631119 RepID=UPI00200F4B29|nr:cobalamin biosynthesis protein [Frankia sp. AgB32]MCK9898120.1 cobalamin biosynthesis protein [Frankia sp. AgB32]